MSTTVCPNCGLYNSLMHHVCPSCGHPHKAQGPADRLGGFGVPKPLQPLRCSGCGGPHPFDTTVPSVVWNQVIRVRGLPEYLCLTCIVKAFAEAGEGFTAELWSEHFGGVPIEFVIGGAVAEDAAKISRENTDLRAQFKAHTEEVGKVLSELYAIMVDPLADGPIKVADTCAALLEAAKRDREAAHAAVAQPELVTLTTDPGHPDSAAKPEPDPLLAEEAQAIAVSLPEAMEKIAVIAKGAYGAQNRRAMELILEIAREALAQQTACATCGEISAKAEEARKFMATLHDKHGIAIAVTGYLNALLAAIPPQQAEEKQPERDPATVEQLWKDPDWDCPRCRFTNLAIRDKCRNCGFDSALVSGGVLMDNQSAPTPAADGGESINRERWLLGQIIEMLPTKRDWLDPAVEREARAALATPEGK